MERKKIKDQLIFLYLVRYAKVCDSRYIRNNVIALRENKIVPTTIFSITMKFTYYLQLILQNDKNKNNIEYYKNIVTTTMCELLIDSEIATQL